MRFVVPIFVTILGMSTVFASLSSEISVSNNSQARAFLGDLETRLLEVSNRLDNNSVRNACAAMENLISHLNGVNISSQLSRSAELREWTFDYIRDWIIEMGPKSLCSSSPSGLYQGVSANEISRGIREFAYGASSKIQNYQD